jgi:protein TonB
MPGLKAASTPGLPASTPPRAQNGPATTSPAPAPDADKVYGIGEGIAAPVPIDQQDPIYTGEAKRAGIQGEVNLSGIVETTGVLDQIEVTKSLDTVYGLDQAAIDAAKAWRFTPGTKDGRAVPVRVELIMEFRLH